MTPAEMIAGVFHATYETLAHLELLRREGRALRSETNGVVRYQGR